MSTHLLLGIPGSGKSYEAVAYHIIPALRRGRKVITNLPLNREAINDYLSKDVTELLQTVEPTQICPRPFAQIEDFQTEWRGEGGVGPLYVIDECHFPFPHKATPIAIEEWFSMHRHQGADILLITQSYGKVSKSIIELVDTVWKCRKNIALGSTKTYRRITTDGVRGAQIALTIRKYEKEYFPLYKSHTLSSETVNEENTTDIKPIWRHWTFICAAVLLAIAIPKLFYTYRNGHNGILPVADAKPIEVTEIPKTTLSKSVQTEQPAKKPIIEHPLFGQDLSVVGYLESEKAGQSYQISVNSNAISQFLINTQELQKLGYTVMPYTPCVVRILYKKDFDQYIICRMQQQGVQVAGNQYAKRETMDSRPDQTQQYQQQTKQPQATTPETRLSHAYKGAVNSERRN